jgi:hypothetical protein
MRIFYKMHAHIHNLMNLPVLVIPLFVNCPSYIRCSFEASEEIGVRDRGETKVRRGEG